MKLWTPMLVKTSRVDLRERARGYDRRVLEEGNGPSMQASLEGNE